jgi:hypothetical protein
MNSGENLLATALKLGFENLAFLQAEQYMEVFNYDFFLWCVAHCKDIFLKKALHEQYFDLSVMNDQRTITYLI